ncbi:hypothetical protein WT49_08650 [Burkholderia territorii]|nr:hypothetical protein WS99_05240 [Burkholderia territorii]KWE34723.1 hypothetical protein WT50_26325 [Burkholderia territorii]KWE38772.1 hypothetical protein WT49_08650 [Burkholderia territorii]KWE53029.1 hypothetical protein WT51_08005 [Burkholderia territorii]
MRAPFVGSPGSNAVASNAMTSNPLWQQRASPPFHPAQQSGFRYQKSMFPVRSKTRNTLLTRQQPDRDATRRWFDRSIDSRFHRHDHPVCNAAPGPFSSRHRAAG